jgi:hypothetical protein
MKVLSREDILSADDVKLEKVEVPEWGGVVFVRPLTGVERDEFDIKIYEASQNKTARNVRGLLVCLGCVGEDGKRLFTEEHISVLGSKNAAPLDRIADKIRAISGLNETGEQSNLKEGQSEDSTSG